MYKNTTSTQDKEISEAQSANHIDNLIDIITDLDDQLTEKIDEISGLKETVKELESKIQYLEESHSE